MPLIVCVVFVTAHLLLFPESYLILFTQSKQSCFHRNFHRCPIYFNEILWATRPIHWQFVMTFWHLSLSSRHRWTFHISIENKPVKHSILSESYYTSRTVIVTIEIYCTCIRVLGTIGIYYTSTRVINNKAFILCNQRVACDIHI